MKEKIHIDAALQPKQLELARLIHATGQDVPTWIAYGGSRGGGKSAAIRRIMLERRARYPGTVGLIVRRVFDDVKKNHIDPFFRDYPGLKRYYTERNGITLPNGSTIVFGYAETAAEVSRKFWGPEFFDIFVDQAEQFSGEELLTIKTANRWPNVAPGTCKLGLFFNPGGVGTEFLRRVFWLKQYQKQERPCDYAFLHAYGWDNYEWFRGQVPYSEAEFYALPNDERFELFINQTSEGRKLNSLPASLRAGHLLGSFESFAGQYYAGVWDESKCLLSMSDAEQIIQPWWTRWMSQDWGFAHNAVHLWFASGKLSPTQYMRFFGGSTDWPVDVVICYRELVVSETAEIDLAQQCCDLTPESERKLIARYFLSPDAFAKRGDANTVAEQMGPVFTRIGLPGPEPADNDRVGGWRLIYNMFRQTGTCRDAVVTQEMAKVGPLLLISANCPQVIAAIPLLVRDPKDLEDVLKTETTGDDVGDSLRYGLKSFLSPRNKAPKDVRAKEAYEAAPEDPTQKALAMRRFELKEKKPGHRRWR